MGNARRSEDVRTARASGILLTLGIVCCAVTGSAGAQAPQAPAAARRFDVASVKPSPPVQERRAQAARAGGPVPTVFDMRVLPGGRFTATMTSLRMLVSYAFDVRDYQIEGGPAWSSSDYFDITASAGGDAAPEDIRAMLKTLLVERFRLRARLESRQAPVHVLTIARRDGRLGPELRRTTPECQRQIEERKKAVVRPKPGPATFQMPTIDTCGGALLRGTPGGGFSAMMNGVELTRLLSLVSEAVSAPVVDRTGLSGLVDFTLEYMPERARARQSPGLDANANEPPPPPIATALQQQLGLKLEKQVGPLPVVVVEGAERPMPD